MATITFEIDDKMLKKNFASACKEFDSKSTLSKKNYPAFVAELTEDIKNYILNDPDFLFEGINNDGYTDFMKE